VSSWVKFERANVERGERKVESKTETRSKALERKFRQRLGAIPKSDRRNLTDATLGCAKDPRSVALPRWKALYKIQTVSDEVYYPARARAMAAMNPEIMRSDSPRLSACWRASSAGDLTALVTAREDGAPWSERTCMNAAREGHLDVLKYAHENGCPWDEKTCECAATRGHLEVLQYARANGCPWDETTCAAAAKNGHLETLKWARENGAPAGPMTAAFAAYSGHLEILQWAVANGCPWDKKTLQYAEMNGQSAVLEWAKANGCPEA
jgi:hypothetical protein